MRGLVTLVVLLLATAVFAQIRDLGLEKGVDEFTGTVTCEQWVVNLSSPSRLTVRIILDERRSLTFSIIRNTASEEGFVQIPWAFTDRKGVLLRFADGEVRGLFVENTYFDGDNQYVNIIIAPRFLDELLAETSDLRFRLIDSEEGDYRQHFDGTLTVAH